MPLGLIKITLPFEVSLPAILDNLFQKNSQFPAVSEYVLAYDLLSQVINQGYDDNFQPQVDQLREGRTVAKRGVMNFYDSFISMRNSYAHPEDKAKNPERKWPLGEEYYDFINLLEIFLFYFK